MTRPTRTLLILTVMSIAAVVALAMMAQRYGKVLERRGSGPATRVERPRRSVASVPAVSDPQGYVDRFLRVRRSLRAPIETLAAARGDRDRAAALAGLLEARRVALDEAGLDPADYVTIRSIYRQWRESPDAVSPPYRAAFARDPSAVEASDLGAGETLDP